MFCAIGSPAVVSVSVSFIPMRRRSGGCPCLNRPTTLTQRDDNADLERVGGQPSRIDSRISGGSRRSWEVTGGVAVEPAIACAASHTVRRVSFSLDVALSQRRAYAAAAATLSIPNGRMSRKRSGPPAGRGRRVCRGGREWRLPRLVTSRSSCCLVQRSGGLSVPGWRHTVPGGSVPEALGSGTRSLLGWRFP